MLRRVIALSLLALCSQLPRAAQAAPSTPPVLTKVLEDVKASYNKLERPIVIFAVDGALLDSRTRTLQILKEYGNDPELRQARAEAAAKIAGVTLPQVQPLIADTLHILGVSEDEVINNAVVFSSQHYNRDDYLQYDTPVAGTAQYIAALYRSGAHVVYVSNRDVPRQLMGTVKKLRDAGFPVAVQGFELILKPSSSTPDAVFQQQIINYLRYYGKVVAAFDTEPSNVNVYRRAFSDATVVLMAGQHLPNAPLPLANVDSLDKFDY